MTIISGGKIGLTINRSAFLLGIVLLGCAIWFVVLYSQVVSLEHRVGSAAQMIEDLRAKNADLKNVVFGQTAPKALLQIVDRLGLIKVTTPLYLEVGQQKWVSVSRY